MNLNEAYALFQILEEHERAEVDLWVLRSQMIIAPPSELAKLKKAFDLIQIDQDQNYGAHCEACGSLASDCSCLGGPTTSRTAKHEGHGWGGDVVHCWDSGSTDKFHRCTLEGWTSPSHHEGSFDPQPATFVPPAVTYWAIIESAGKKIHVSLDSKHVSGPEKRIATGGMQKVWKWIHDKGLGDQVGLQDAFDLAQSMEVTEDVKNERVDSRVESVWG